MHVFATLLILWLIASRSLAITPLSTARFKWQLQDPLLNLLYTTHHSHTQHTTHSQHVCKWACSEEVPEPVDMGGSGFSVAFDPLDGSSIVDTNFSVGTIFGVWPGE